MRRSISQLRGTSVGLYMSLSISSVRALSRYSLDLLCASSSAWARSATCSSASSVLESARLSVGVGHVYFRVLSAIVQGTQYLLLSVCSYVLCLCMISLLSSSSKSIIPVPSSCVSSGEYLAKVADLSENLAG